MKEHDFEADKAIAKEFLANYLDANDRSKYMDILKEVSNRKIRAIQVDLEDLFNYKDYDEEFVRRLTENTRRYVSIFSAAIDELLPIPTETFPDDDHDILMTQRGEDGADNADVPDPRQQIPPEIRRYYEVYFKAPSKGRPSTIREVKASHIGQLVRIAGIITRCSDVKPLMAVAVYTCEDCGHEIYQRLSLEICLFLEYGTTLFYKR